MNNSPSFQKPETFRQALPWITLVAFMFVFSYLNRAAFGPLFGFIEQEMGLSHSESTLFLLYIAIGYALSVLASAITCSLMRPRHMVGLATITSGITLMVLSQTHGKGMLSFLFFLVGVASGHYFNAGLSVLRSLSHPQAWGRTIAVHELGPNASFILGPLLAAASATHFGWRPTVCGLGVAGVLGGILFLYKAKGGYEIPMPTSFRGMKRLLATPAFWVATWLFGMSVAGEFAPYSVLGLLLQDEFGFSAETAATLLGASRIAPPLLVLYGGYLAERMGPVKSLRLCLCLHTASMALMTVPWLPTLTVGMFLQPVAAALTFPPLFLYIAEHFDMQEQPLLFAIMAPFASLFGSGLVPQMLGLAGDLASFRLGFAIMAVFVGAALPFVRHKHT